MPVPGASQVIAPAALSWEGEEALAHRFGGTEFRVVEEADLEHALALLRRSYEHALSQRKRRGHSR